MLPACTTEGSWEHRWGIPEWERRDMTICIAAICESGRTIVVGSDRELGIGFTSAEFHDGKWLHLYDRWSIGFSGTVSNATDVILMARRAEKQLESHASFDVSESIAKAYQKARLRTAAARFLANRGWTIEDYRQFGAKQLPPDTYATIDAQISVYNFDADLILAGFGEEDLGPSILTVKNPGVCIDHSKIGFWCVGTGSTAAQMSLFSREYAWSCSPERAAYYVYEAKVAAEHATGVGKTTDIHLIRRGANNLNVIPLQLPTMETLEKKKRTCSAGIRQSAACNAERCNRISNLA
jgi:20S proteasome alpha/beta subunit